MPKKAFKCTKCSRKFSMAAHLARHMNTLHGSRKRKTSKRPVGRPRSTRAMISADVTSQGVVRLLKEMDAYRTELAIQRHALDMEIQSVDAALNAIGGITRISDRLGRSKIGQRGRPAGSRKGSLKQAIIKVMRLKSKPMAPREIAAAVKASGYQSYASDLTKIVSNTLPELENVKKVGRAQYKIT